MLPMRCLRQIAQPLEGMAGSIARGGT